MKRKRLLSFILTLLLLTQVIPSYAIGTDIGTTILEDKEREILNEDVEAEEVDQSESEEILGENEKEETIEEKKDIEIDENVYIIDKDKDIGEQIEEAKRSGQKILFQNMDIDDKLIEMDGEVEAEFKDVTINKSSLVVTNGVKLKIENVEFKGSYRDTRSTIEVSDSDIRINEISIIESLQPIKINNNKDNVIEIEGLKLENNINDGPLIELDSSDNYAYLELSNVDIINNRSNYIEGRNIKFLINNLAIREDNNNQDSDKLGLFFTNENIIDDLLKEMKSSISDYKVDVKEAPSYFNGFINVWVSLEEFKFVGTSEDYIGTEFNIENSEVNLTDGEVSNISSINILESKNISGEKKHNIIKNLKLNGHKTLDKSILSISKTNEKIEGESLSIDELVVNNNQIDLEEEYLYPSLIDINLNIDLDLTNSEFSNNETIQIIKVGMQENEVPVGGTQHIDVRIDNMKFSDNTSINTGINFIKCGVEMLNSEFIGNIFEESSEASLFFASNYSENQDEKLRFVIEDTSFKENISNTTYISSNLIKLERMDIVIKNSDFILNEIGNIIDGKNTNMDIDNIFISENKLFNIIDMEVLMDLDNISSEIEDDLPKDMKVNIRNPKIVNNKLGAMFKLITMEDGYDDSGYITMELLNGTIVNNRMNSIIRPSLNMNYSDTRNKQAREMSYEDNVYINIKNTILYDNNDISEIVDEADMKTISKSFLYQKEYSGVMKGIDHFIDEVFDKLYEDKQIYKDEDIDKVMDMLKDIENMLEDINLDSMPEIIEKLKGVDEYLSKVDTIDPPITIDNEKKALLEEKLDYMISFTLRNDEGDEPGALLGRLILGGVLNILDEYEDNERMEIIDMVSRDRRADNVSFYHSLFNNKFYQDFNTIDKFGVDKLGNILEKPLLDSEFKQDKASITIDKGNNEYVDASMEYDFTGRYSEDRIKRILNNTVDIGAHEYVEKIGNPEEKPSIDPGTPTIPSFPSVPGEKPKPQPPIMSADHIAYIEGYKDNTVRPNAHISREEMSAMLYRLLDSDYRAGIKSDNNNFSDVDRSRWSNKHISTLAKGNLVLGYPDGTFRPVDNLTRAEAAVLIYRFGQVELDEKDKVKDIKLNDISGHWAEEDIIKAVERGWIDGYPDGSFKPSQKITRAEMVTLINRMLNRHTRVENMFINRRTYKDLREKEWYYEAFEEAINGHEYDRLKDNTEKWTEKLDDVDM